MVGALWTGISGLGGSQTGLDNESNNIANVNTIGYKSSRVSFTDQMYQDKIGKGVTSFDVEKLYTQGNLKNTGVSYDLALSGDGFFQVKDGNDTYYTRAGNFRMGEGGALEDVTANTVQGWAIQEVSDEDITSTNSNIDYFTSDYSKLLGNKVIQESNSIDTIIAKATDYESTAESDSKTVFTGAGYKTAASKISDVETLITAYTTALSVYAETDPKPTSSSSSSQKSLLNFSLQSDLKENDTVYVQIDGISYETQFDTDNATTMKNLADVISNSDGFTAYLTDDATSPYDVDTQTNPGEGFLVIEGLVPGESFSITEFAWKDALTDQAYKGDPITLQSAVTGTGMGHIDSISDALAEAVSGKQMDVYTPSEIAFDETTAGNNIYTYQVDIYDEELGKTVTVPASPLVLGGTGYSVSGADDDAIAAAKEVAINDMVTQINSDSELSEYVEAFNFNGNIVIKPLDANYSVEFTGELSANSAVQETQTIKLSGTTDSTTISFLGTDVTVVSGATASATGATIVANAATIISAWNAENSTREIDTIINQVGTLLITYKSTEGNVSTINKAESSGITFNESLETQTGRESGVQLRSADYSGTQGAGAEFLKMTTSISQTASKSDLQLRLDTLGLTDSAFGDFDVDDSGLITMTQDGAQFAVGQIAVARFTDNIGLEAVGDNLLEETTRSGSAIFNQDNSGMAEISGGTLELSTADLSESLVNLMVFQRAFEANAKSITTADEILTTLIGLKR